MLEILQVIWEFLKIGLFTIGGGQASLPFFLELPHRFGWFTTAELMDMIAISNATPGAVGIKVAAFAGYHIDGIWLGLAAGFAIILPGAIIAYFMARAWDKVKDNKITSAIVTGVRPAVTALIMFSSWRLIQDSLLTSTEIAFTSLNIPAIIWFIVILFAIFKFKQHPIVYIVVSAIAGIFIAF